MFHKLYDAGKIDEDRYLRSLSKEQLSEGEKRILEKRLKEPSEDPHDYLVAILKMLAGARYRFALRAVVANADSEEIRQAALGSEMPSLNPVPNSNAIESYRLSFGLYELYHCNPVDNSSPRYLIAESEVGFGQLLLLGIDTLHPVIDDVYRYEGSATVDSLNGVVLVKIEGWTRATDLMGPFAEFVSIINGHLRKVFEYSPWVVSTWGSTTTRTLCSITYVDLNQDSKLDIVLETTEDIIPSTAYDRDLESIKKAIVIKHVSRKQSKFLWNKETGRFVELK